MLDSAAPDRTFTLITQKDGEMRERVVSVQKKRPDFTGCQHDTVVVDKKLWRLECAECGESLDPIQFLIRVAEEETIAGFNVDYMRKEHKRIEDALKIRTHTKCEHCGKSTKITGLGLWSLKE